mgnify:CR=1 FL=1
MASFNKVFLMGNLTRDPEQRQLPSGTSVCMFGLAVNRQYKTAQGEDREETCFVDIETWGRQAELCADRLRKGEPVMIEGRLQQDRWEDRQTGEARSRLRVRALRVQFMGAIMGGGRPGAAEGSVRRPREQQTQPDREQQQDEPAMPDFEPVDRTDDDIPF